MPKVDIEVYVLGVEITTAERSDGTEIDVSGWSAEDLAEALRMGELFVKQISGPTVEMDDYGTYIQIYNCMPTIS